MCASVGEEPHLAGKPTLEIHGGHLRIGNHFHLASRPVPSHLAAGPGALLQIGNDVSIGCGAAIAAFEQVRIGNGTRIGPFVIIMDTNFHGASGDQSVPARLPARVDRRGLPNRQPGDDHPGCGHR